MQTRSQRPIRRYFADEGLRDALARCGSASVEGYSAEQLLATLEQTLEA